MKKQPTIRTYTLFGIGFGFLFPLFSTLLQSYVTYSSLSWDSLVLVQCTVPLIWVINTAPLFLGIFARAAGIRQVRLDLKMTDLELANDQISRDIIEIKDIERELRAKEKIINDDLRSAMKIQNSFLPSLPQNSYFDMDYLYAPKALIGGDFLKIVEHSPDKVALFIGDVSGHGIAAALITTATMSLLNTLDCGPRTCHREFIDQLNDRILEYIPDDRFITALFGTLERHGSEKIFTFIRAGHTYPLLWRQKTGDVVELKSDGQALGLSKTDGNHEVLNVKMSQGDRLFLYTDGVTEYLKSDKMDLNVSGFKEIIASVNKRNVPVHDTLRIIKEEIEKLGDQFSKKDDQLMIIVEAR